MSESTPLSEEAFVLRFRRELERRVGGRCGGLEIRRLDGRVEVSCTVPSYHVKQLVILAAVTSLVADNSQDVVLNVRVSAAPHLVEGSGSDGASAGPHWLSLSSPGPSPRG